MPSHSDSNRAMDTGKDAGNSTGQSTAAFTDEDIRTLKALMVKLRLVLESIEPQPPTGRPRKGGQAEAYAQQIYGQQARRKTIGVPFNYPKARWPKK